jgi:hypothetical protein
MKIVSQGFDIESEIAIKAGAMGLKSYEIPFAYRERIGQEKLQSLPDGFRIGVRILNTGIAYNPLLALFAPGLLFMLIGLCGLLWIALSNASMEAYIWRVYTFSLVVYLIGGQLVVAGLGSNWHAFTQGIRRRIPSWIKWLTNRLSNVFIFWTSVFVGACGFILAFLMNSSESSQYFRWGLCFLTIGFQIALLSRSLSVTLRLSKRAPKVVACTEIEKQ